ncbi:MAG: glycogen/starch/alpha-glucan phosphorylase, partial [Atopobiaceae bacterium]|nr:glycogen/starch/alpha-glucan phosphorylase [Atopobiaceae bacterium]
LADSKRENKERLASYIRKVTGIELDPGSVFDVQVKRFHASKHQLLNVLKILDVYRRVIADPSSLERPVSFIFGGKAAQSYDFAKEVIRLIGAVAHVVNNDPRTNGLVKVAFVPNFGVSNAQLIYAAAEVSEQISTAGKEASGTSNMKLMMNGAITLGTLDGSNVEISRLAGEGNIRIFGMDAREVQELRDSGTYWAPSLLLEDPERLGAVVEMLRDGSLAGLSGGFETIYDNLTNYNDQDFVLRDFHSYTDAFYGLVHDYGEPAKWNRMALKNIANSGFFSSDRTIREYAHEIWHVG